MALRMARRIDDAQARNDFVPRIHQFDLVLDRRVVAACPGDKSRTFGGEPAGCVLAAPEIPFCAPDEETCTWRNQIIEFIDRAPKMIGVPVGENNLGYFGLVDARGLKVVPQLAGSRHKSVA